MRTASIFFGNISASFLEARPVSVIDKKNNKTIINISDYSNLWADHKRSKFEQISFEKKDGFLLPIKIIIHFDGRIFKLEQN